jgi:transcriptional regulator with XRE-family HTH domain
VVLDTLYSVVLNERMDMSLRIGAWLRAKGRSQAQLAAALNVRPSAVSMWITGKTKRPSEEHLKAMCAWFGITLAEFYGDAIPAAEAA